MKYITKERVEAWKKIIEEKADSLGNGLLKYDDDGTQYPACAIAYIAEAEGISLEGKGTHEVVAALLDVDLATMYAETLSLCLIQSRDFLTEIYINNDIPDTNALRAPAVLHVLNTRPLPVCEDALNAN